MQAKEDRWIHQAQNGSRKAFDQLARKYVPMIFRLLYDMTHNYEDSQDLTQESCLKAFLNIQNYRKEARFSTWLYRIAYRVGIDHQRKKKNVQKVTQDLQESLEGTNNIVYDCVHEYTVEEKAIEVALQKLTNHQRTAIVLNYYHGFRMREIGEIMGCSEGTVRVHIFRALQWLRKELKEYFEGV